MAAFFGGTLDQPSTSNHHHTSGLSNPTINNANSQATSQNFIVLIAKFDYTAKEKQELDLRKGERLLLIDNSKKWWFVRRFDTDKTGYVPSNYVKKEKKSLLEKIIPRKLQHQLNVNLTQTSNGNNQNGSSTIPKSNSLTNNSNAVNISKAVVKHKYIANKADELTLNVGSKVIVLEKFVDGWWKVCYTNEESTNENETTKLIGLYPSNYLQEETNETKTPVCKAKSSVERITNELDAIKLQQQQQSSLNNSFNHISPRQNQHENALDISCGANKCESVSSNEKEIEYLRVIFPHVARNFNETELTVCYNEIVKLVDDENNDDLDYDKSWIKVFNSQGITGIIPSNCVEPFLENKLNNFVFIRRPTCVGLFANYDWYFGNISRFDTILLLNKYGTNGDFLVRDSDNSNFSISLKSENTNNKHFKVFYKENKFLIGKKIFNTMSELLEHYHHHPIFDQNGEKLFLIKPFEPPSFDSLFNKSYNNTNMIRNMSQISTMI